MALGDFASRVLLIQLFVLLDDTVPKIFDELKEIRTTEFKKWLKLRVHSSEE
jgi:hypothetical protein